MVWVKEYKMVDGNVYYKISNGKKIVRIVYNGMFVVWLGNVWVLGVVVVWVIVIGIGWIVGVIFGVIGGVNVYLVSLLKVCRD